MIRKFLLFALGSLLFVVATFGAIISVFNYDARYTDGIDLQKPEVFIETNPGQSFLINESHNLIYTFENVIRENSMQPIDYQVYSNLKYELINAQTNERLSSNLNNEEFNPQNYLRYSIIDLSTGHSEGDIRVPQWGLKIENAILKIGLDQNNVTFKQIQTDQIELANYYNYRWGILMAIPALILGIIFLVDYGKTSERNILNSIPVELFIPGLIILGMGTMMLMSTLMSTTYNYYHQSSGVYSNYAYSIATVNSAFIITLFVFVFMLLVLLGILYLISNLKHKTLIKNSLLGRSTKVFKLVISQFRNQTKLILFIIGLMLFHLILLFGFGNWLAVWLLLIVDAIILYYIIKLVNEQETINNHLHLIRNGQIDVELDKTQFSPLFADNIDDINNLNQGFVAAVEKSLQEERMSIDLITNVSHDLKTPLTSILNYVQLIIDNENPEKHDEYLQIIKEKALRLSDLSSDVVEASKASSGKVDIHLTELNALEMLNQVLVEHQAGFEEHGLILLIDEPSIDYEVMADSQKLYRVYENLFKNIEKYALENTRVYIEGSLENSVLSISFKNVSKYQLGSKDLTARFVQGDEARSDQGNGLGLAIAKDLMRLQNGELHLEVDGDLFKIYIKLKRTVSH